jgi:hypothetical protein
MGTRSATLFIDGNHTVCHLYRQLDGYPQGHGVELARICNVLIVNGITGTIDTHANGISCLAARAVAKLKTDIGSVYLRGLEELASDWCEYIYVVRRQGLGQPPIISCSTKAGPWPFNLQTTDGHVFTGTPAEWLARFGDTDTGNAHPR